jgi:CheY-like chemotaxis protein
MPQTTIEHCGRQAELLLVEDNYGDVVLTQEAFSRAKVANHLSVARDGEQALQMLRRQAPYTDQPRPDLVLLDLNLPRLDGQAVLKAVKADPATQTIPVVVMTSSRAEIDILKSYQLNANGYIVKPVDFERLSEVVASIESFWFQVVVLAPAQSLESAHA